MSAFDEVLLPLSLALGAVGGPERRTDIVTLGSGREARNTPWAQGRRRYDIGGGLHTLDELYELLVFFEARKGRFTGFRFRDFLDWKSCTPGQTPTPLDQLLGAGDGETPAFQLIKNYAGSSRTIAKPVAGSVLVAIDSAATTAFTLDVTTGVITFHDPPPEDAPITAGFLFDTPVRFDADRLDIALDAFGAGRAPSIPLIEILP